MTIVYLYGPLTQGDQQANVDRAIKAFHEISRRPGMFCFCPHLYYFANQVEPRPYMFWMSQDLWHMQALRAFAQLEGHTLEGVRLDGESPGGHLEENMLQGYHCLISTYDEWIKAHPLRQEHQPETV